MADDETKEPGDVAPVVEDRALRLGAMVAELREIPVAEPARSAVRDWLADWDTYVNVGTRYADALRSGSPAEYSAVAMEGAGPQARISAFARTNRFDACALDGVPLPARESPI